MENLDFGFVYGLLGETATKVLLYLHRFNESYATEIANHFSMSQQAVMYQMDKLEKYSILKSRLVGKTRLYRINPRYVLRKGLRNLLEEALLYMPNEEKALYYRKRTRPRTKGKQLRKYQDRQD